MAKDLERDLGLVSVVAISMGAMIGSGIFILPGLAMAEAGPAVILAFLIAGVLVIPAALSISELGTAMPVAGGDYVFIERGMGPAVGTIAGIGTWLTLLFKGALALVGGMFYLDLLLWLPGPTTAAVLLSTILIAVNLVGVKQTGQLQSLMVIVMMAILGGFILLTVTEVDSASYDPFFTQGVGGLVSATAMVIVSYAGVTKVASVAEEIENPERNLPLGLLLSLSITTLLYVLIVYVLVGIVDAETLSASNVPMAIAVEPTWGTVGVAAIVVAAIMALVSTANAGILTASRYPLALSRDSLIPKVFEYIHPRFLTPTLAILTTGAVMVTIIVLLPVVEIAKMASAFQILVYTLVNLALIAFRERNFEWYDPDFRSPGYPWVQLFGAAAGIVVIFLMDVLPLIGAVGIIVGGGAWYWFYVRAQVSREGVVMDTLRRETGREFVADTAAQLTPGKGEEVLIALRKEVSRSEEDKLLRLAAPIAKSRESRLRVVRFEEVPDQYPLERATKQSPDDIDFEERTDRLASALGVRVEVGEIVSHDTRHAVVNYAKRTKVDIIISLADPVSRLQTLLGRETDWIMEHAPCDVALVHLGHIEEINEIAIVTDRSPFNDPLKVELADVIARQVKARIKLLFAVKPDAPESLVETIRLYHSELDAQCVSPVEGKILRTQKAIDALTGELEASSMVMLSTDTHRRIPTLLFHQEADKIATRLEQPVMLAHAHKSGRKTLLTPLFNRILPRERPKREAVADSDG